MSLDWHAAITLRSLLWCCSNSESFTQGIQCKRYRNLQKIMPFILNKRWLSVTWCSCTLYYFISDVDIRCKEFDNGTSLHIASSNLCLEGAKCLVSDLLNSKNVFTNRAPWSNGQFFQIPTGQWAISVGQWPDKWDNHRFCQSLVERGGCMF